MIEMWFSGALQNLFIVEQVITTLFFYRGIILI